MKRMTGNKGAARTRRQILRHIRSIKTKRKWRAATATQVLDELASWVRNMAERADKKAGGLGNY